MVLKKTYRCVNLILLLLTSNIYSNMLLERPKDLSALEIEELVKSWETQFTWNFGRGCNFMCCYEQGEASFIVQLFGIPIRSYNFRYLSHIKKLFTCVSQNRRGYYFAKPLLFDQPSAEKLKFDELCTMLKNKNFIFYTGAGISAAGKVATMHDLEAGLKLGNGKKAFLKEAFLNPKAITMVFSTFCESALYRSPTPAHHALCEIAHYRNISILTENVDLLQQRTGICPLFVHSDVLYSVDGKDFQEIDIIVCIGLSHDDCGFIAYYKEKNPHGLIIAIDLGMPHYLSNKDFILQGDLQIILPDLASFLCK
jgi:hypothetical protein